MRKLVLLRGPIGVGKSTWIKKNDFEKYTLSADNIRQMYSNPITTIDGESISQEFEAKVWETLFEMLEERMKCGDFTVVDATHVKQSSITAYKHLCQKYGYRCYVVNIEAELDVILNQNKSREKHKFVDEDVVRNSYTRSILEHIPGWVVQMSPSKEDVEKHLEWGVTDYDNEYERIVVIGDVHGCYDALVDLITEIHPDNKFEIDSHTKYIFVGDYLDRGPDNDKVFKFLYDNVVGPNNTVRGGMTLLQGNHDTHLRNWGYGDEVRSREFVYNTLPQLEKAGITQKMARQFSRKLQQISSFKFNGDLYFVSHGGITPDIQNPLYISTNQFINGIGGYEDNIDKIFSDDLEFNPDKYNSRQFRVNEHIFQIHGHRNMFRIASDEYKHSFNLEGQVEHGGHLRAVLITKDGREFINIKNNNYVQKQKAPDVTIDDNMSITDFMLEARSHDYVKENALPDGISSFNFTRKAFIKRAWDEMTVKARGLFINTEAEEPYIAARSYDKFFNDGERSDTKPKSLLQNLVFPLSVYKKENGYLGLISYDKASDELKFYSKSISSDIATADYANNVKDLAVKQFTSEQLDTIKKLSKNGNSTFVFEVILVDKDPHIIKYEKDELILLDVIDNELKFKKLDYQLLVNIGDEIGCRVKELEYTFDNWKDYFLWYNEVKNDYSIEHEGFVVEDSNYFMFKIKLPYYSSWKKMRSVFSKIKNNNQHRVNHGMFYRSEETEFYKWLLDYENKDDLIDRNLIKLRDKFTSFKYKN